MIKLFITLPVMLYIFFQKSFITYEDISYHLFNIRLECLPQHVQEKRPIIRPSAPLPPQTAWAGPGVGVVFHSPSVSMCYG